MRALSPSAGIGSISICHLHKTPVKPWSWHHRNKTPNWGLPKQPPTHSMCPYAFTSTKTKCLLFLTKILFTFFSKEIAIFFLDHWIINMSINYYVWLSIVKGVCRFASLQGFRLCFLSSCVCFLKVDRLQFSLATSHFLWFPAVYTLTPFMALLLFKLLLLMSSGKPSDEICVCV